MFSQTKKKVMKTKVNKIGDYRAIRTDTGEI